MSSNVTIDNDSARLLCNNTSETLAPKIRDVSPMDNTKATTKAIKDFFIRLKVAFDKLLNKRFALLSGLSSPDAK